MSALGGECGPVLRRPGSSHSDRDLFEDLFARRVHDVANGSVCVVAAVRYPGRGAVVAVRSTVAGVDAVATCCGPGGVRVRDIEAWFPGEHIAVVDGDALLADLAVGELALDQVGVWPVDEPGVDAAAAAVKRAPVTPVLVAPEFAGSGGDGS